MNDYTQDGQREKWHDLAHRTIDAINAIDDDTPTTPTVEPSWWVHMTDIRGKMYDAIAAAAVTDTRQPATATASADADGEEAA